MHNTRCTFAEHVQVDNILVLSNSGVTPPSLQQFLIQARFKHKNIIEVLIAHHSSVDL